MDTIIPQKCCNGCKQYYPATLTYFQSDKAKRDHLTTLCKTCRKARKKPKPRKTPVYIVPDGHKRCSKCGQIKPATKEYFHASNDAKSKIRPWCKECAHEYVMSKKPPNLIPEGHKQCSKCKSIYLATRDFFHYNEGYSYNLSPTCKQCSNAYLKERRRLRKKPVEVLPDGCKRCTKCKTIKPATFDYFGPLRTGSRGLYPRCRECCRIEKRLYWEQEKGEINERRRAYGPFRRARKCQQDKRYYLANRAQVIASARRYYMANKERLSLQQRRYYLAHRERYAEIGRIYRQTHKVQMTEYYRVRVRNRRARLKSIPGAHTVEEIRQQFKRQKGKCYYCHHKLTKYHVDHTFPVTREHARNSIDHLVITCPPCNQSKGNKYPWEWPEGGRLL